MCSSERGSTSSLWLTCIISSLLMYSAVQEEIFFTSEPQSYYYSLPDHITFIPCVAVRVDDAGDEFPITAVPYRNSERLTSLNKPDRHHLHVTRGKVAGVVVSPTRYEDTGARYWCQVERGGQVVAESQRTCLVVGDGRPLPVRGIYQLDQGLYSVALEWNAAQVSANSPILRYVITVIPEDQENEVFTEEVDHNRTSVELFSLQPASVYLVAVAGINEYGTGNASQYHRVMTMSPEVPRAPTNVMVRAIIGTTSTSIIISWTPSSIDPEVMTPLTSYIIYYGTEDPDEEDLTFSVVVPEGHVSEYTVTGIAFGGLLRVGVAAVNSAGSSQVAYSQHSIGIGCAILKDPDNGLVLQTGKDIGSRGNYSCEQGFTLSGNATRACIDHGEWSGREPTCNESPSLSEAHHSSKMTTVFISVAIILGIMLFVTVLLVLTVALRRVYVRKDRQHVIATQCPFDNASPPLNKRLKKPSDGIENFHEQTLNSTALTVLQSAAEDEARTPPPSEPITFLGTPPPPSYTDLAGVPSSGTITSPRRINSDFSPPSLEVDSTFLHNGSCVEESTHSVRGPLGVQYSIEPRVTGSRSPTPGYRSSGEAGERAPRSAENGEKV